MDEYRRNLTSFFIELHFQMGRSRWNIRNSRPNYIMDYVASVDLLKKHLDKFWRSQESGCYV